MKRNHGAHDYYYNLYPIQASNIQTDSKQLLNIITSSEHSTLYKNVFWMDQNKSIAGYMGNNQVLIKNQSTPANYKKILSYQVLLNFILYYWSKEKNGIIMKFFIALKHWI
jgi:hypothetical protein